VRELSENTGAVCIAIIREGAGVTEDRLTGKPDYG